MPKKNVLYGAIEYLKQRNQSSETRINTAIKGNYHDNADDPYYVVKLAKTNQSLTLDENQPLICTEQHATFFARHEADYRASDLHYTATFKTSNDVSTYKLRVFIDNQDEPTGDISFYKLDSDHTPHESTSLTPDQIGQAIQYALSQTSTLLKVLRREHTIILNAEQMNYAKQRADYTAGAFESTPTTQQLTYARAALASIDVLRLIDSANYQNDQRRFLAIINFIENPPMITAVESAAVRSATSIPDEDDFILIDTLTEQTAKAAIKANSNALILTQWTQLQASASSIREAQKPENVPTSTLSSKINPAYLDYIRRLDTTYRAFVADYLLFEDRNNIALIVNPHGCGVMFETIREQQTKLVIQCLKTLCMIPSDINIEDTLQTLSNYASKLEPKLFRIVIGKDNANIFSFLLEHFPFQTTLLTATNPASIYAVATENTLLEEIIIKHALNCLRDVISKKYHLNFLDLASDGLPLASHIFRLSLLDNFRFICLRDIPAFNSDVFYRKLIAILKSQPNRVRDIENAAMAYSLYKRSSPTRLLAAQEMEASSHIPESAKHAMDQLIATANEATQLKLNQVQQFRHAIHDKYSRIAEANPRFRRQLSASMSHTSNLFKQLNDENPHTWIDAIQSMTTNQLDYELSQMINHCHALNEYLYYSLPDDPTDPEQLPPSARANLRSYHFERLKAQQIMREDPLRELRQVVSSMHDALTSISAEISNISSKWNAISEAHKTGEAMDPDAVQEAVSLHEGLIRKLGSNPATNQTRALTNESEANECDAGNRMTPN